jgi:Tfp pilus assembly protein PilP
MGLLLITSCVDNSKQKLQDSMLQVLKTPHKCFKQHPATKINPPAFYTCDKRKTLCTW